MTTVTVIDEHFAELEREGKRHNGYAGATLTPLPNGTALVHLRDFVLPKGWNRHHTNVYFLIPVGYPVARPDTFWTDAGLCLASGAIPANTGVNAQAGMPPNLLWFSWHPSTWNPNRDTLITYAEMINRRFEQLR